MRIDANLIRGNMAGAGDGGGIRVASANGEDVAASLDNAANWHLVRVFNNMISNNVAGLAGGGISLEDSVRVVIRNNTVVNNDSTATTAAAFEPGAPNVTVSQPAGIVSRLHGVDLNLLMGDVTAATGSLTYSNPVLRDSIVYHNRSFYWLNYDDPATPAIETGLLPANCPPGPNGEAPTTCDLANVAGYTVDLGVLDGIVSSGDALDPRFSLLTDTAGYAANNTTSTSTCPGSTDFVNCYYNGARNNVNIPEFTTLQTAGAFDEGGNFIQVAFGPLSLVVPDTNLNNPEGPLFDYHLLSGSVAIDAGDGVAGLLLQDFDNDPRPQGAGTDIGADEAQ